MFKIMWTNKYSQESGYVKSVKKKDGYFINTFDFDAAKSYASESSAKAQVNVLKTLKDGDNNDYRVLAVEK